MRDALFGPQRGLVTQRVEMTHTVTAGDQRLRETHERATRRLRPPLQPDGVRQLTLHPEPLNDPFDHEQAAMADQPVIISDQLDAPRTLPMLHPHGDLLLQTRQLPQTADLPAQEVILTSAPDAPHQALRNIEARRSLLALVTRTVPARPPRAR